MSFKDHFSSRSDRYAEFRPHYPDSLFEYLASLVMDHSLAWDCATGNGQAAQGLALHFEQVVATDASRKQIQNATQNERVHYCIALAEHPPFHSGTVDVVTIAQALHWLQTEKLFAEVNRILKSGGICAAWCYNLAHIDSAVDPVLHGFDSSVIGAYWAPERRLVVTEYLTIPFPFEEMRAPVEKMEASWDLQDLLGFLSTWSSVQKYQKDNHSDPIDVIRGDLSDAWGDPLVQKRVVWPLSFRIGRKV